MAWSTPITAVANATFTSAQYNASDRDNMNLTPAALATTAGYHFASAGTNSIAERAIVGVNVDSTSTTTLGTYADPTSGTAGPTTAAITTGPQALVWISAQLGNSGAGQTYASYGVSGATTVAPSDTVGLCAEENGGGGSLARYGTCNLQTGLTPGSNTFYIQYRVASLTGSYLRRRIQVMSL